MPPAAPRGVISIFPGDGGMTRTAEAGKTPDRAWMIGGKTGEGVDSAGEVFAAGAARSGLEVHTFRLFPPIIKGGPTSYEVRMSAWPLYARSDLLDCLVALDDDAVTVTAPPSVREGYS